jgi:hypothetical protein
MRGTDEATGSLFSYVDLEERIPARHPLRKVREIVNDALASMGQDRWRHGADDASRRRKGPRAVHAHHGGLQSRPVAPPVDRMKPRVVAASMPTRVLKTPSSSEPKQQPTRMPSSAPC